MKKWPYFDLIKRFLSPSPEEVFVALIYSDNFLKNVLFWFLLRLLLLVSLTMTMYLTCWQFSTCKTFEAIITPSKSFCPSMAKFWIMLNLLFILKSRTKLNKISKVGRRLRFDHNDGQQSSPAKKIITKTTLRFCRNLMIIVWLSDGSLQTRHQTQWSKIQKKLQFRETKINIFWEKIFSNEEILKC